MPGIIFQTQAIKVVNSGGGYKERTIRKVHKDALGRETVEKIHQRSAKRQTGTDYVVFKCPAPGCGKRNKKSMYEAKAITGEAVSFICYACRREIEVDRPKPKIQVASDIVVPEVEKPKHVGLLGPDGRPIQR